MDIRKLLTSNISVTSADLKAVRTFLVEHYSGKKHFSRPINFGTAELFRDHYLFTYVDRNQSFSLQRSRYLIFAYDVLEFKYSGRIESERGVIRDDRDRETVDDIIDVLTKHCYGSIIEKLDNLK